MEQKSKRPRVKGIDLCFGSEFTVNETGKRFRLWGLLIEREKGYTTIGLRVPSETK